MQENWYFTVLVTAHPIHTYIGLYIYKHKALDFVPTSFVYYEIAYVVQEGDIVVSAPCSTAIGQHEEEEDRGGISTPLRPCIV